MQAVFVKIMKNITILSSENYNNIKKIFLIKVKKSSRYEDFF